MKDSSHTKDENCDSGKSFKLNLYKKRRRTYRFKKLFLEQGVEIGNYYTTYF